MLLMVAVIKASLAVTCYNCTCRGEECNTTSCQDPFNPGDNAETCEGDLCHADKMDLGQFTYTNYFYILTLFTCATRSSAVYAMSTWLAGCMSQPLLCITTKPILTFFRPSGSPISLGFLSPCADTQFLG